MVGEVIRGLAERRLRAGDIRRPLSNVKSWMAPLYGVRFATPRRPLVFINGCDTTAMASKQALSLVDGFVREGNAGVPDGG